MPSLGQKVYDSSKDYLVWKEGYSLTWGSYKAEPDATFTNDYQALTYVSFLPIGRIEDAKVVCVFDSKRSWTTSKSVSLLAHQQLHFDLGELYARRIRRDLQELQSKDSLTHQALLSAIESNYEKYSQDFLTLNKDSFKGSNKEQVNIWSEKIRTELKLLAAFKID